MQEASEAKYLDPEKLCRLSRWRRSGWRWHADLFQYQTPSFGPAMFSAFCGGHPVFGADTVWYAPVISGLDQAGRIRFDENNRFWKAHLETVAYLARECRGRELLGLTDFGGPTDWIANLMGTERFLLAAIDQPDAMRAFALRLSEECNRASDLAMAAVSPATDGFTNWMPVWSDRTMGTVQDDMAINLSPGLYQDVFVPALRLMAAHTERTVLHWHDGAGQHIDTLLAVQEIDLIQYGHDPNSPPFPSMIESMRRIQAAGKKLFISCVDWMDTEFFIRHLDPRGLMMIIDAPDDEASRRTEENAARWTAERCAELG